MQWLIANMWMAMAAATVLGLLFGFAFRGVLVSNRIRRAEVEREIAKTELTQSKAEVEALYAAQRKHRDEVDQSPNSIPAADLEEREGRIATLSDELAAARAELESLKSDNPASGSILETAGAATAGAIAGAVLSNDDSKELTELRDRNAWLEDRVGSLETELAAAAPIAETSETPVSGADEKTRWQASYLRMRVNALEEKLIARDETIADVVTAPIETAATPEPETPSATEVDEELAELRWRNRYLEGRLAYFEQAPEEVEAELDGETEAESEPEEEVQSDPVIEDEAAEPETDSEEAVSDVESEPQPEPAPEPEAEVSEDIVSESEVETAPIEAAEPIEEVHPSEAMLAELDGKQPLQLDRPSNGGDDLTKITGIGPRIAEVLNSLGIWTFAQIAEWQPENETWIENHLSFKGRVSRENWVGQSKELLVAA